MENAAEETADGPSGQGERYALETVLSVFEDRSDRARPLTANDVMDELGCSRRTAHNKLNALVEAGDLATRKVGARSRVWWIPFPDATAEAAAPARTDGPERDPAVEVEIATAELPVSAETLDARRDALRAAYDYLTENPNTTTSEFLTEVFPDHPADFKTADEWWDAIQPALEDLPNVDSVTDRAHVWHYTGG